MPAAAVIPAPIAYMRIVAVKKLVVELRPFAPAGPPFGCVLVRRRPCSLGGTCLSFSRRVR